MTTWPPEFHHFRGVPTCRYCARPATEDDPFRCQTCLDLFADHMLPLAERVCTHCEQRATVKYRCTRCDEHFTIEGVFRWHWQGKGHWHEADNERDLDVLHRQCGDHPHHVSVPVGPWGRGRGDDASPEGVVVPESPDE